LISSFFDRTEQQSDTTSSSSKKKKKSELIERGGLEGRKLLVWEQILRAEQRMQQLQG